MSGSITIMESYIQRNSVHVTNRLIKLDESNPLATAAFPQPEQNAKKQLAAQIRHSQPC